MPNCVVSGCKNYEKKNKKLQGVSYHRFPNDPVRKEIWSRIIREQRKEPDYKPHNDARVCSAHFYDSDVNISKAGLLRLKTTAIPRIEVEAYENAENRSSMTARTPPVEEIEVDISDLNSIIDLRESHLKNKISKLEKGQSIARKKIKKLQRQNAMLEKKTKSQQQIIKFLKRKKNITEEIKSALGTNAEIAELYRLQLLKLKNKPTKKKRLSYPPALRKFAMTLNFYSPSAYKYVRRKFDCCLPNPRTLIKWYSTINGEPGSTINGEPGSTNNGEPGFTINGEPGSTQE